MLPRFEQFIRERRFLANASAATIEWYTHSLPWLRSELPSDEELKETVMRMREKGRNATGCNTVIRAINAYLHWNSAGMEKKCGPGCVHLRVPYLKEPQLVLPTFTKRKPAIADSLAMAGCYWSGRLDLNQRPPEPHSGTLPDCATPRLGF